MDSALVVVFFFFFFFAASFLASLHTWAELGLGSPTVQTQSDVACLQGFPCEARDVPRPPPPPKTLPVPEQCEFKLECLNKKKGNLRKTLISLALPKRGKQVTAE